MLRVPAREDDVRGATLPSGWVLYAGGGQGEDIYYSSGFV